MFRIIPLIVGLGLMLGGCATINALTAVSSPVTAQQAIVAANTFDGLEAGGTAYLTYCKSNGNSAAICSAANRRTVIQQVRAGRASRNQIETTIASSCPAGAATCSLTIAAAVYNAVVNAVQALQGSPAASYVTGG